MNKCWIAAGNSTGHLQISNMLSAGFLYTANKVTDRGTVHTSSKCRNDICYIVWQFISGHSGHSDVRYLPSGGYRPIKNNEHDWQLSQIYTHIL